jgi:hypothetical protein
MRNARTRHYMSFWAKGPSGGCPTQKQPYGIQQSMEQFGYIYIIENNGKYDKNRKQFRFLTDQIGDPDMVRV